MAETRGTAATRWIPLALVCGAACLAMSCAAHRPGGAFITPADRAAEKRIRAALAERLDYVEFKAKPLKDALAALGKDRQVNILLDPKAVAGQKSLDVTIWRENIPFADALTDVLRPFGLRYVVADGVLFVSTPDAFPLRPVGTLSPFAADATRAVLLDELDKPLGPFEFIATPLDDVLLFFGQLTKTNIVWDREALSDRGELDVSVKLPEVVTFKQALAWLCRLTNLDYTILDEAIFISTPKRFRERPLGPVERTAGVSVPGTLRTALEKRVCPFEFVATPLEDVLTFFRTLTKMDIQGDRKALADKGGPDITLRLNEVKLKHALAWVCRLHGLEYTVRGSTILVSTPEGIKALNEPASNNAKEDKPE